MGRRRRFGVSVSEEYSRIIDALAERLGTTRSGIVERALQSFVRDHAHYLESHECAGLLIVYRSKPLDVSSLLEEYRDIIKSVHHHHFSSHCLDVIMVEGDSKRIASIDGELARLGCRTRFIPVHDHKPGMAWGEAVPEA